MKKRVVRKHNNSGNCFVCGINNPYGLHSRFYELEDGTLAALVTLSIVSAFFSANIKMELNS